MNAILDLIKREPVAVIGIATAALDLAMGFGLPVSPEQKTLIIAFVTVLAAFLARSQVSPVATSPAAGGQVSVPWVVWLLVIILLVWAVLHFVLRWTLTIS